MATVAFTPVGSSPTVPMDWSRGATHRITMMAVRMTERVTTWLRLEPRIDAWCSYGALAIAAVGAIATLFALRSF